MILSISFMNTLLVLEKPFVFPGDCGWSLKNLNDGIIRSHQVFIYNQSRGVHTGWDKLTIGWRLSTFGGANLKLPFHDGIKITGKESIPYKSIRAQIGCASKYSKRCFVWSDGVVLYSIKGISRPSCIGKYSSQMSDLQEFHDTGSRSEIVTRSALQWCQNERDDVSNHRRLDFLFNCLFRRASKKTSKLRVTGLCEGIPLT